MSVFMHPLSIARFSPPALARLPIMFGLSVVALGAPASAQTFTSVTVAATSNIFGAGYGDTPAPGGGGGGTVAPSFSLSPGTGRVLSFSNITGAVGAANDVSAAHGPDGYNFANDVFNVNSYRSISGVYADTDSNDLALLAVFTDGAPTGTAPTAVDVTTQSVLPAFSPLLNQTFFVGDGLTGTGSGTVQQFLVPDGATTLTLGFADAYNIEGDAGYYNDNVGSDTASLSISPAAVPEASTTVSFGLLLALGLGGSMIAKRRKSAAVSV